MMEPEETAMSEAKLEKRLAELDRLLNDPDVRMDPHRVWTLMAEISRRAGAGHETAASGAFPNRL